MIVQVDRCAAGTALRGKVHCSPNLTVSCPPLSTCFLRALSSLHVFYMLLQVCMFSSCSFQSSCSNSLSDSDIFLAECVFKLRLHVHDRHGFDWRQHQSHHITVLILVSSLWRVFEV